MRIQGRQPTLFRPFGLSWSVAVIIAVWTLLCVQSSGAALTRLASLVGDTVGDAASTGGSVVSTVGGAAGDVASTAGGAAGDIKDTATGAAGSVASTAAGAACSAGASFADFVVRFNRTYSSQAEYEERCRYFADSLSYVVSFASLNPKAPFEVAVNELSDWSPSELKTLFGAKPPGPPAIFNSSGSTGNWTELESVMVDMDTVDPSMIADLSRMRPYNDSRRLQSASLPQTVDYRDSRLNPYGVVGVTAVKDQGKCGSCYAHTTVALLEGQLAIAEGSEAVRSLSPQQVVDCGKGEGNNGCNGGRTDAALQYFRRKGGSRTLQSYPYSGKEGACQGSEGAYVTTWGSVTLAACKDSQQLMKALFYTGPVSIYMKADCRAFMQYSKGVLNQDCISPPRNPDKCYNSVDHAVLLVGYGRDESSGLDYWLVRNSWGSKWGEGGYFRIQRGTGDCDMSCLMAYPISARNTTIAGHGPAPPPDGDGSNGGRSSQKDAAKQAEEAVDAVKEAASKAWKGANSKEAKQIAIGAGVGGGVMALAIITACACVCRRRPGARK